MSTADFDPERFNKGQLDFINENTKRLLARWAAEQLTGLARVPDHEQLFWGYACTKGWVKKDGSALTTKGFQVAAAYLRR